MRWQQYVWTCVSCSWATRAFKPARQNVIPLSRSLFRGASMCINLGDRNNFVGSFLCPRVSASLVLLPSRAAPTLPLPLLLLRQQCSHLQTLNLQLAIIWLQKKDEGRRNRTWWGLHVSLLKQSSPLHRILRILILLFSFWLLVSYPS